MPEKPFEQAFHIGYGTETSGGAFEQLQTIHTAACHNRRVHNY